MLQGLLEIREAPKSRREHPSLAAATERVRNDSAQGHRRHSEGKDDLFIMPAPLASGGWVTDASGIKRRITGITVNVDVEDSQTPLEVELEFRYNGWWSLAQTVNGR